MSVNCWSGSRSKSVHSRKEYLNLKYGFDVDDQADREYESCVKWSRFWGRLRGLKKGFMGQMARQGSYDRVSYMQNFDEGLARAEPEYFTRSFSARFADPRRVSCSRVLMNGGE
ncbi:hypothetical protein Leryth_011310 [Lithospermum erythrorhizon]|nr:hypothetical protein Leryth_011310 [Lithospermum erythrorhizon]